MLGDFPWVFGEEMLSESSSDKDDTLHFSKLENYPGRVLLGERTIQPELALGTGATRSNKSEIWRFLT